MKQFNRNKIFAISVIGLLVLFLILLLMRGKRGNLSEGNTAPHNGKQGENAVVHRDSLSKAYNQAPVGVEPLKKRRTKREPVRADTGLAIDSTEESDTSADTTGQNQAVSTAPGCTGDTAKPWIYPDPSGGLHRKEIRVVFGSTKPCVIEWKTDSVSPWVVYTGESIPVKTTTTLYFRGHDTCGNVMEPREEIYEIRPEETGKFCPEGMEYVNVGATRFCIDQYEWPNKKGRVPQSFVSLYQAMDSCVSYHKHLCTSDEWTLACTGPYGWRYPYGAAYEPHACVTQDTSVRVSGSKAECRGYFDVYDMAGNLAEWTNTKSDRNPQFYNVKGGFWESGPRSGCFDVRYSYYPQNRHNPVGFRCCKEASP